ncbi:MAG: hypothetical protein V7K41_22320 [Nostoc sp.]|uniref:hypothetical protein n=1 Tax=Nostoc sp. TaxID=1180 RepID=UPI002FF4D112
MEEKCIYWTNLYGNPYRFGLHPSMLTPEGYQLKLNTKIRGQSKRETSAVIVTFDENYVISFLSQTLGKLQLGNYNEWQKIISKAYLQCKQRKEQVQQ